MEFTGLRIILGALCILFATFLGRSIIRRQQGIDKQWTLMGWVLRVAVTGAAVFFRVGFDRVSIPVLALVILATLGGAYLESRPKHHDELEKVMFPRE